LEGGGCGVLQCTIPAFTWTNKGTIRGIFILKSQDSQRVLQNTSRYILCTGSEKLGKISVLITGQPLEIRTEGLLTAKQES